MKDKLVQCLSALHVPQYLKASFVKHLEVNMNQLREKL